MYKKQKKAGKKKKQKEQEQQQQVQENGIGDEAALMELYAKLVEFYTTYKPENLDEDVLTILIQFVIDCGSKDKLNAKLMSKYGEDLNTFDPMSQASAGRQFASLNAVQEEEQQQQENSGGGPKKPQPPSSPKPKNMDNLRKSLRKVKHAPGDLDALDFPKKKLEPRDLLEAFYSMHDESKLSTDTGVEKFVIWAETNGLAELDKKLKNKYNNSLMDKEVERIALRRRNLEDSITAFYMKYDIAKLNTRFTVLNIVNWTMKHGLIELNEKFMERYGRVVVDLEKDALERAEEEELDI